MAATRPTVRALERALPSNRSVLTGCALIAAALGLYAVARGTSVFAVHEIRVEGAPAAIAKQVRGALADLEGASLVAVDAGEVRSRVEALPAIQAAALDRAFPHELVVTVVAEQPAAVIRRGAESWLLSVRGRVVRQVKEGALPRLPRLWLPKSFSFEQGGFLHEGELRHVVLALEALAAEPLNARVQTVRSEEGEVSLVLAGGLELRLGEAVDLPLKVAVARKVLPLLGGSSWAYLDLSVPEKPVAGTLESKVEVEG